jgi:hypothetical protein
MALRVARGLFRLWLVLSVLWIGGVGYVTWRDFPKPGWGENDLIAVDPAGTDFRTLAEARRLVIWDASFLAFLPPAFVLALGSALVWASRGFR